MPGEAYRDALSTAKARIQQLESDARERGIPLVFRRQQFWAGRTLALLIASYVLMWSVIEVRGWLAPATVTVDKPLANASSLPPTLAWFEPAFQEGAAPAGPIDGHMTNEDTIIILGLVWRRGHPDGGLHVAAWNASSLTLVWVSDPVPAHWVSETSDWRFTLSVVGELGMLVDRSGHEYAFDLDNGRMVAQRAIPPAPILRQGAAVSDVASAPQGPTILCGRFADGFELRRADSRRWTVGIPNTGPASRLRFVKVHGIRTYVLVDDELHVFDTETGEHRGILEAP